MNDIVMTVVSQYWDEVISNARKIAEEYNISFETALKVLELSIQAAELNEKN